MLGVTEKDASTVHSKQQEIKVVLQTTWDLNSIQSDENFYMDNESNTLNSLPDYKKVDMNQLRAN
jgi:hypothetical protein